MAASYAIGGMTNLGPVIKDSIAVIRGTGKQADSSAGEHGAASIEQ